MGCNAAKGVSVVAAEENGNNTNTNGFANRNSSGTIRVTSATPGEVGLDPAIVDNATVNNVLKAGNGVSFEITFEEKEEKNDGNKLPPKRILELKEAENEKNPVTLEDIQEKLEEAEIRRQQILQQRVQSANLLKKLKNNETLQSVDSDDNEQSPNHLKIPKKESPHPPNPYDVSYT